MSEKLALSLPAGLGPEKTATPGIAGNDGPSCPAPDAVSR